ncbi:DUF4304 domain-containing protein [Komagataeibacter xylinus]|nr:DUF4304 domain-containing protein [Komagataeibacter xylinus]GBQ73603.1 hypothetical protein AA15237_1635 [Komagataeibacter xylinus NBRC 15237]
MTYTRADMDRELKASVVPWLRQQGFRGSLTHFRRPGPDAIDLLTFQFDLRGGGYVLEVARCATQGYTMAWGEFISPRKVTAWHITRERERITPEDTYLKAKWFRFDQHTPQELAAVTIEKLSDPALWPSLPVAQPPSAASGPE